uniref:Solute carrier organic anion transporter family member n=1 Tax=Haemonchus contortus TaxID=6289 RepID=A0A7I4YUP1_HAECO
MKIEHKGNRARWIGGGCMLIAIANLLISSSNFLFPVEEYHVNSTYIPSSLAYEVNRFVLNVSTDENWFNKALREIDPQGAALGTYIGPYRTHNEEFVKYQSYCFYNPDSDICARMEARISKEHQINDKDVSAVRVLTSLPYSFCHNIINKLRQDHKSDECKKEQSSLGPFIMIFGGLMLLGVGRTMPFSLGLPLMDDNVKKNNLPLYFACMFFVKILGPIVGLLVGSKLNEIYYNFDPPQGLTPLDPMWIGCWWLGFLIFGALLFFPSLVLFLFPSDNLDEDNNTVKISLEEAKLNGTAPTKPKKALRLRDKHVKIHEEHVTAGEKINEFLSTVRLLFRNPIYVGAMLGRIVDVLAFKGFFVFLGKYLEIQFGVPQYRIQKYLAGTGVVGFACGVIIGSVAMRKFHLQGRKAATWVAVGSLVAALLSFANGAVGCKSVIGQIGEQGLANNFSFPSCRKDCVCDGMPFYPVCNTKGDVFYSPCQAGCPLSGANFSIYTKMEKGMPLTFTECECSGTSDLAVSRDYCPTEHCNKQFHMFFFNQAIGAVFAGSSVVPGMLIVLRSVHPEHRSISLGFNGFLVSLLATLPSPVFWGKIFDLSCLMWQNVCSKTGACPIYDTDQLRIRLHLIYGGLRILSLLSDIWVIYWAKGLKLVDEEDENELKKTKDTGDDGQELTSLSEEARPLKVPLLDSSHNKEAVLED